MQQFRLPILLSILVLSHIVHPVMAADETDSHPTATLTTDSEELSVQYPDILSLEWGIANQNNRLETYSVNLSVEDDRGLVIWDGPTQYWQFQPFESHTFRAPFRPADSLPAGVYPLVVSISEMSPEVSSSASTEVRIGEIWVLPQETKASFESLQVSSTTPAVSGNAVELTGSMINEGESPARFLIGSLNNSSLALTEIGLRSGERGWFSANIPTDDIPVGIGSHELYIFSSQGGDALDSRTIQFEVTEAFGELQLVSLTAQQSDQGGWNYSAGQNIELTVEFVNRGSIFCSGELNPILSSNSFTHLLNETNWYFESGGGGEVQTHHLSMQIPDWVSEGPYELSLEFEETEDECNRGVDVAHIPVKIVSWPSKGIIRLTNWTKRSVVSQEPWLIQVEITNTARIPALLNADVFVTNGFTNTSAPKQQVYLESLESDVLEFRVNNPVLCYNGHWDVVIELSDDSGALLDTQKNDGVLHSISSGSTGELSDYRLNRDSSYPGETVLLDVLVSDIESDCGAVYVVDAVMVDVDNRDISSIGGNEIFINSGGSLWTTIPLAVNNNARSGAQTIEVSLFAGVNNEGVNSFPQNSMLNFPYEILEPNIAGGIVCDDPGYTSVNSGHWVDCDVHNHGNIDSTFRTVVKSLSSQTEIASSAFEILSGGSENLMIQFPEVDYGRYEIEATLEAIVQGVWAPIHNWSFVGNLDEPVFTPPQSVISDLTISPNPPIEGAPVRLQFYSHGLGNYDSGYVHVDFQRSGGGGLTFSTGNPTLVHWGIDPIQHDYTFTWPSDECNEYFFTIEIVSLEQQTIASEVLSAKPCSLANLPNLVPGTILVSHSGQVSTLSWNVENTGGSDSLDSELYVYIDGEFYDEAAIPRLSPGESTNGVIEYYADEDSVIQIILDPNDRVYEEFEGADNEYSLYSSGEVIPNWDQDLDGLDDTLEIEGWDVIVIQSRSQFESVVTSLQLEEPALPPIAQRYVTSSIYSSDSDSDGLSDLQEFLASSDPWDADTDDDGLIDSEDPEPTIVELTAPTVELLSLVIGRPGYEHSSISSGFGDYYTVQFRVSDPNLQSVLLEKVTYSLFSNEPSSTEILSLQPIDSESGLYQAVYKSPLIMGYEVNIRAADYFGNEVVAPIALEDSFVRDATVIIASALLPFVETHAASGLGIVMGAWASICDIWDGLVLLGELLLSGELWGLISNLTSMAADFLEVFFDHPSIHAALEALSSLLGLAQDFIVGLYEDGLSASPFTDTGARNMFALSYVAGYLVIQVVIEIIVMNLLFKLPPVRVFADAVGDYYSVTKKVTIESFKNTIGPFYHGLKIYTTSFFGKIQLEALWHTHLRNLLLVSDVPPVPPPPLVSQSLLKLVLEKINGNVQKAQYKKLLNDNPQSASTLRKWTAEALDNGNKAVSAIQEQQYIGKVGWDDARELHHSIDVVHGDVNVQLKTVRWNDNTHQTIADNLNKYRKKHSKVGELDGVKGSNHWDSNRPLQQNRDTGLWEPWEMEVLVYDEGTIIPNTEIKFEKISDHLKTLDPEFYTDEVVSLTFKKHLKFTPAGEIDLSSLAPQSTFSAMTFELVIPNEDAGAGRGLAKPIVALSFAGILVTALYFVWRREEVEA